ncbi:MAG: hypothetical protein QOJ35_124 [Solirubrobacteraceae bacterium]|jgi:hypothetical protein|nr:hypothetical protein [Solirubrobacteraceae bacterium]
MRYQLLGFAVWKGARWYVRRRVARLVPSRRVVAAATVLSAVGVLAVVAANRDSDS